MVWRKGTSKHRFCSSPSCSEWRPKPNKKGDLHLPAVSLQVFATEPRRRGLQKDQGRVLVQLREKREGGRIEVFEAGRQLIDQARLHLDQGVLFARQGFQLLHLWALGPQT